MRHFDFVNCDLSPNFYLRFKCINAKQNYYFVSLNGTMLEKKPISKFKRVLGLTAATIFVAESIGIAVTYGLWYKLNTEREFRLYMYKNYNWVLEGYYKVGETLGGHKTRELDTKVWTNEV
ncbi:protein CEBPZOS-like isoform X3 [Nymphalis io]|uniref:protein CEBPZOS-like isoform X3 n=1 Tax=Inachis io TaxID=171585 RepID=UPI00216A5E2F|nr:protein CEBPZOS-like isoform X3 [Nymphalis io]